MNTTSRLRLADLFGESLAGLLQRPARTLLTMLGTVLGIGAFVSVIGLTASATGQIDKRFTALAATEVTVEDAAPTGDPMAFPPDATTRIKQINGVAEAGIWWTIPLRNATIGAAPGAAADGKGITFTAAEPSTLDAMHVRVSQGAIFNHFHQQRGEAVAVLGSAAASQLGITRLDGHPAVFVNGTPYTILGIIDEFERKPEMLFSVIIPSSTALAVYGEPVGERAKMLIETELGAATVVASQASVAILPNAPGKLKTVAPPDPQTLRDNITADLDSLFLLLAVICLVVGAVGIANTTLVAVLERTGEIGLRRTLGARKHHIATQFLTESTALGLLGGLIGTTAGVAAVTAVALAQGWTALLPAWAVLPAPLIGALTGFAAGTYPALRAAAIEPAEALRR